MVLLAIGVTVHAFVVRAVDQELQRQLALHAEFVTTYVVAPALAEGRSADEVAASVVASDPQVNRLTIRDADEAVLGRAGERTGTDVTDAVPVPGREDLRTIVDQDSSVVQAAATDLTRRLAVVLGAGLAALWLAIVPLAYRLGRELRAQADELREQSVELQRLLDQEQLTVERLREVDHMRDRFLESISHELRTPLTVVKGSLQMLSLKGDGIPAPMRAQLVDRATEKAERLSVLLQALLDLNSSAETPDNVHWVDLRAAVDDACRLLPDRDVTLDLQVDGIVTNRAQLVRALGALVGNAVRHAPGDDPVLVQASTRGGADVELVVADRGPGIPTDLREAVFEPFRQGELLDGHSPGTGIGLSLVAAYAAQHGGRAWADERPGGGAELHVLLRDVVGTPEDHPPPPDPVPADDADRGIVVPVASGADRSPPPGPDSAPADATATADPDPAQPQQRVVRRVVQRADERD